MAIDFPNSPYLGQVYTSGYKSWTYNGTFWQASPITGYTGSISPTVFVSDSPPAFPAVGNQWWNSALGTLFIYYYDGTSYEWVEAAPAAVGATGYTGSSGINQGTPVTTTSGTSTSFSGIPFSAKRISILFQGVQTSGTSFKLIQLGTSGGFVTSNYIGSSAYYGTSTGVTSSTAGFPIASNSSSDLLSGKITLDNYSGNQWIASGTLISSSSNYGYTTGGYITAANLGGVLTQVRITTVNGTDTLVAGAFNVLYE